MRQGREELMNDTDKKQRYLDEKMNNFARNLNEQFRQNTTLYKEERNLANTKATEDRHGLTKCIQKAHRDYIRQARHFIYISGTGGKDGSINRDILDYLLRLPTRNAHNTENIKMRLMNSKITRNNTFGGL